MRNRQARSGPIALLAAFFAIIVRAACRKLNQARKKLNLDFGEDGIFYIFHHSSVIDRLS